VLLDAAKVSPHQEGLSDLLAVATLKGYLPDEMLLLGVQIEDLGVGLELSPAVAAQIDRVVDQVVDELARWDIRAGRKGDR
jgi:hydrogenase maturation protease